MLADPTEKMTRLSAQIFGLIMAVSCVMSAMMRGIPRVGHFARLNGANQAFGYGGMGPMMGGSPMGGFGGFNGPMGGMGGGMRGGMGGMGMGGGFGGPMGGMGGMMGPGGPMGGPMGGMGGGPGPF